MDAYSEEISYEDTSTALSYDDGMTYEDQVAALPAEVPRNDSSDLVNRISANKVYLPPESLSKGKRKRGDGSGEPMDEEEEEGEEGVNGAPDGLRSNALYLRGSPITHLPTNNIFAYARHFNTDPVGLEWIDDSSCVLVFPTNATCRTAFEAFRRIPAEEPDFDDCVSAKPIPLTLWPVEDRINKTLGMAEGLGGTLLVRIARTNDKKVRGAKLRSAFYQKHGLGAGKDPNAHTIGRVPENGGALKRRKMGDDDDDEKRRQLDDELDNFLHDGDDRTPSPPPSPPSKMRSDYLTDDGREIRGLPLRSLLDRTSLIRAHLGDEERRRPSSRSGGRRQRGGKGRRRKDVDEEPSALAPHRRRRNENGEEYVGRSERPKKSLQELDDELDAFLNAKD